MGRLSNRRGTVGTGSMLALQLAPRHYFYDRCNEILAEADFDETVEMLCQPYYEDGGRLSIPPGRYFRMLVRRPVRGPGFRARDRVALCRLAIAAPLFAVGRGRTRARPLDTQRDPLAAAAGSSSCRVRLHPGGRGPARPGPRPPDRPRCLAQGGQCFTGPSGSPGSRRGLPGDATPAGPG